MGLEEVKRGTLTSGTPVLDFIYCSSSRDYKCMFFFLIKLYYLRKSTSKPAISLNRLCGNFSSKDPKLARI